MESFQPSYLKTKNRKLVLDLFSEKITLSRAEITRLTGMSFPTVLKIVDRLIELGIVIELEETEQMEGAGRKGHLLQYNPNAYYAISVIAEGEQVCAGLIDMQGKCRYKLVTSYTNDIAIPDTKCIMTLINKLKDRAEEDNIKVLGVCIGLPVVINPNTNSIVHLYEANITTETPFEKLFPYFFKMVGLPCFLENDVNLKCLGEAFMHTGDKSFENLLYLSLGSGLGAGIYLNGQIWHGMHFKSGEIGDMILCPDELPSLSGGKPKTLESFINLSAIHSKFGIDLHREKPSIKQINDISDYIVPYLQLALYNLSNVLDLKQCIVTGIIPQALGNRFYKKLQKGLSEIMPSSETISLLTPVNCDAELVGAAVTVFSNRLESLLD